MKGRNKMKTYQEAKAMKEKSVERKRKRTEKAERLNLPTGKPKSKKKREKSLASLDRTAWKWFSKWIRVRDALRTTRDPEYALCVTCFSRHHIKDIDAGHCLVCSWKSTKFHLHNVHAQCTRCNRYLKGDQLNHSHKIEALYGNQEMRNLENLVAQEKIMGYKFTREELTGIIDECKELVKPYLWIWGGK